MTAVSAKRWRSSLPVPAPSAMRTAVSCRREDDPRQHEVRDVRAGNQQHAADDAEEQHQRQPHLPDRRLVEALDMGAVPSVRLRKLDRQRAGHRRELGTRLTDRPAVPQPRHSPVIAEEPLGRCHWTIVSILAPGFDAAGKIEARGHDADTVIAERPSCDDRLPRPRSGQPRSGAATVHSPIRVRVRRGRVPPAARHETSGPGSAGCPARSNTPGVTSVPFTTSGAPPKLRATRGATRGRGRRRRASGCDRATRRRCPAPTSPRSMP